MKNPRIITAVLLAAAAIWSGTVVAAYRTLQHFETTPGRAASAPSTWPSASRLVRVEGAPTLVMLVHPRCSCSRASMTELEAIIEKSPRTLRTYVVVYRPHDAKVGWERTDIYDSATRLRGTHVVVDEDGVEARRFGTFTSGQTFVYDAEGHLRFEGGITSLRGHAGINRGRVDVIHLVNSKTGSGTHPVFGCSIVKEGP